MVEVKKLEKLIKTHLLFFQSYQSILSKLGGSQGPASSYQPAPKPAPYQSAPKPAPYQSAPKPAASYQSAPKPYQSYQSAPKPVSFQSAPRPAQYQSAPKPVSFQSAPSPASLQSAPRPSFPSFAQPAPVNRVQPSVSGPSSRPSPAVASYSAPSFNPKQPNFAAAPRPSAPVFAATQPAQPLSVAPISSNYGSSYSPRTASYNSPAPVPAASSNVYASNSRSSRYETAEEESSSSPVRPQPYSFQYEV